MLCCVLPWYAELAPRLTVAAALWSWAEKAKGNYALLYLKSFLFIKNQIIFLHVGPLLFIKEEIIFI